VIVLAYLAAGVLAFAGAAKLLDPIMTAGALRAMRLPANALVVRAGAAAELALAVGAVVVGGPCLWALVGLSYALFALFVVVAVLSGRPIGSCGCFGRVDVPATWLHAAMNALLGAAASIQALEELSRTTR
jgi:hypothetical protein